MAKSIRRGLFGMLGAPEEGAAPQSKLPWWKAKPVESETGESSTVAAPVSAAMPDAGVKSAPATTSPAKNASASALVKPPVEPAPPAMPENHDDSIHQLVVPVITPRKASVGPASRPLAAKAAVPVSPATPPTSSEGPPSAQVVELPAVEPTVCTPASTSPMPADERFSVSFTLIGWVGVVVIILAVGGGLGYYARLVREKLEPGTPPVASAPSLQDVKAGPVKPGVTNLAGGKAAPQATPGKKPLDLPLAAPNLEKGKRYLVIQEGLVSEDEAADIIRFLKENGEKEVGAVKYRLGSVSKWRVISLKPWEAKDTPGLKKQMDEYKRRIEALGQKYKKAGGHHEFVRPYERMF